MEIDLYPLHLVVQRVFREFLPKSMALFKMSTLWALFSRPIVTCKYFKCLCCMAARCYFCRLFNKHTGNFHRF